METESSIEVNDTANITLPNGFPAHRNLMIIMYSVLFAVAAVGNLTVFLSLFRSRHRKSRISLMIRHLAIADLIVTFIMIPIEIGWRVTGQWLAGNIACKMFVFLRAFGPYLSSNVIVCVSLDRYFAVLHPLKVNDARRRGKIMLAFAWGFSFIYCIPQTFVFRVQYHPKIPNFSQCVSFGAFSSGHLEVAYNLACVFALYFIPLFVIIGAYTAIMCEISKNSKDTERGEDEKLQTSNGRMILRRSDVSKIERARSRTLRMTLTIVLVYIFCCTPYVIITLWYMFDWEGAKNLPVWLQDTFFMMVVSNSCMNPIVYGSFAVNLKSVQCTKEHVCCCRRNSIDKNLNNGDIQLVAGQGTGFARRVIKHVFGLRKAGSAATRSTAMIHGVGGGITRPPTPKLNRQTSDLVIKDKPKSEVLPKLTPRSFIVEHNNSVGGFRTSFHSEPCSHIPHELDGMALNVSFCSAEHSSAPDISPKCHYKSSANGGQGLFIFNQPRTRNV